MLGHTHSNGVDGLLLSDDILNTHGEAMLVKPVVDDQLSVGEEVSAAQGAFVLPNDVDDTARRCSDSTFSQVTSYQLSLLDEYIVVSRAVPYEALLLSHSHEVDGGYNQRKNLLACP